MLGNPFAPDPSDDICSQAKRMVPLRDLAEIPRPTDFQEDEWWTPGVNHLAGIGTDRDPGVKMVAEGTAGAGRRNGSLPREGVDPRPLPDADALALSGVIAGQQGRRADLTGP